MDINKRNRSELKAYFVKNAIPTERNFAEFIEAGLNQRDDGIVKQAGEPLAVEASGGTDSLKKSLLFYESFDDDGPTWSLSLKPRSKADDPTSSRSGFSIHDAAGRSRLFLDKERVRVGIGTVDPGQTLTTIGRIRAAREPSQEHYVEIGSALGFGRIETFGSNSLKFLFDNQTQMTLTTDGLALPGRLNAKQGVVVDTNRDDHLDLDGALYRHGNRVYLTVDKYFFIRDSGGSQPFRFRTEDGLLTTKKLSVDGSAQINSLQVRQTASVDESLTVGQTLTAGKYEVQAGVNGGPSRGIFMWRVGDSNWGIYMGQPGAGKSLASGKAVAGAGFGSHALRIRVSKAASQGFVVENSDEDLNLSVRGSDGMTYVRGSLGVGTTAPADKLHVQGGDLRIAGERYSRLKIVSDNYWAGIELVARERDQAGHPFIDFTHGELGNPNFGVRLVSLDNESLQVESGVFKPRDGLIIGHNRPDHLNHDGSFYRTGGQVYLTVDDNFYVRDNGGVIGLHVKTGTHGALAIGGTEPRATLDIVQKEAHAGIRLYERAANGNLTNRYFKIAYEGQGNIHFYHKDNKGQWMDPNGHWQINSDRILKRDITPLEGILDKIRALEPKRFKWRSDGEDGLGFIAQEVERVFPDLVSSTEIDGRSTKGVAYAMFGVLAVAAVRELEQSLDQHLRQIDRRIAALQIEIANAS